MSCSCSVGRRPDAVQIDAALREGMGLGTTVKTFGNGLIRGTLGKHRQRCLGIQAGDRSETAPETPCPVAETGIQLSPRPFAVPNPMDDAATSPRKVVSALIERRCVELRAAGKAYVDIAAELGINEDTAVDAVERVLLRTAKGADVRADAARALDLQRIDKLIAGVWSRATEPPAGPGEEEDVDYAAQDRAAGVVTKLLERRARLLGLDAPTVSIAVDHPAVRAHLERAWGDLFALLREALRPHPEALRDVMAAMRQWREGKGIGPQ